MRFPVKRVLILNIKECSDYYKQRTWQSPACFLFLQGHSQTRTGKRGKPDSSWLKWYFSICVSFNFPWFSFSETLDSYPLIFCLAALISLHSTISKLGITPIPRGLAKHICKYLTITVGFHFALFCF